MHIPWSELQLFLAVADGRSVSRAAKSLQVTQPTVSRRLAALEAALGEPLFIRKVDGTTLTSFGERMLEPARRMSECADELGRVAAGADVSPRGTVRITAAPGVAFEFLAPFASYLRTRLPDVRLEVVSTVNTVDLMRREADLAIRLVRSPAEPDLVCLASLESRVAAFATSGYIATLPRGYRVADVGWVAWAPPLEHVPPNPELARMIPNFRPIFASDDFLVQLRAARAGVGAIFLAPWANRWWTLAPLVELGLDFGKLTASMHLVASRQALAIPRVRAVAELLAEELSSAGTRATNPQKPKPERTSAERRRAR